MPRFFVDSVDGDRIVMDSQDSRHIIKSLRMKIGEHITVCDSNSVDYNCTVESIDAGRVLLKVENSFLCENEPSIDITLYQALPKYDKMDFIVQKSVELGISKIVPIITHRCISRPSNKDVAKKILRWQKISEEAAKQSGRGKIPRVSSVMNLRDAAVDSKNSDYSLVFYESYGEKIKNLLSRFDKNLSFFVGSEGGFCRDEIDLLLSYGVKPATLGKRILRTETVSLAVLSVLMYETGNM